MQDKKKSNNKITRKDFLVTTAFLGSVSLLATQCKRASEKLINIENKAEEDKDYVYPLSQPENIIYSTCLNCHIACANKAKLLDGQLVKLDGNPYSGQNMIFNLNYDDSPLETAGIDGKICPKGQAAVQTNYDPYRLIKVLKRNGPRGSNKWKTISFKDAINEVVEGGKLFSDIGENQDISGFRDVFAIKDPDIFSEMKSDVSKIGSKDMTVSEFKSKHSSNLGSMIDPDHPDFGPVNNQFVFMAGRIEHGRKELAKRFVNDSFGSINWISHTSICEQSHHIAYEQITKTYKVDSEKGTGKFDKGKTHMKPDLLNSEFVIFFGTGAFEANFGVVHMAEKVTKSLRDRNFKFAVVDPRFSKTAAKAKWWVPIIPGKDGAYAMGMIRWIMENERYDLKFLENANKAAANTDGETTWSDASYLVKIEDGKPTKYLRADEAGLGEGYQFVVIRDGSPIAVTPGDEETAVEGDLFVDTEIEGIKVKSSLQVLKDSVFSRSIAEYAEISGIKAESIETLANEFTSHGKKAVVEFYRGPVQHTNGFYNAQSLIILNMLIGNIDWKGGLSKGGGHWHEFGDKAGPYDIAKLHPGKVSKFGINLSKEKWDYSKTTLFGEGYPSKRPWYPLSNDVFQEIIPSAGDGYPYNIKILFNHKGAPTYSCPAGHKQIEILKDVKKIPLFISCDIVVGETSMYADYIFPDLTFLERWGTPHVSPDVQTVVSKIRQPVVAPATEVVKVDGEEMPISMEAIFLAIASKLKMSGFGKGAFDEGMNFTRPEDYFIKLAANIGYGDKPEGESIVPDASNAEIELFKKCRRYLPRSVYDYERWKKAVKPEDWKRVVYVLNRGGRYENFEKAYKGKYLAHQFKNMVRFYLEGVAAIKHYGTGENFSGFPIYEELKDSHGNIIKADEDFQLITYKEMAHGHTRTIANYWNLALMSENWVMINSVDATRLGVKDGEMVRITSSSNPEGIIDLGNGEIVDLKVKVKVAEGIRPGVASISHSFGHWAYGGSDVEVDGVVIKGDKRRIKGITPNPLMTVDPILKNTGLSDPIGASSSYFDSFVKLTKV